MKKTTWMAGILMTGLLTGISGAQKPGMGKGMGGGQMGGMKGMHKMMMSDSCPMGGMFMHGMMERSMAPTQDGGVVVMVGNQLFKYDKNLDLKKSAEVKIDTAKMRAAMMDAMKACPMMETSRDTATVRPGPMGSVSPGSSPASPAPPEKTASRPK